MITSNFFSGFLKSPGIFRLGLSFFLLFTLHISAAEPKVGLTIEKEGSLRRINIFALSVGSLKSGSIECKYALSTDIDQTFLGSPVSSISLGASIDRTNHKLLISINTTGQVSIDSAIIVTLETILSTDEAEPVLSLVSASFTDSNKITSNATILTFAKTRQIRLKNSTKKTQAPKFFLLNGRSIPQKAISCFQKRSVNFIPQRYLIIKK